MKNLFNSLHTDLNVSSMLLQRSLNFQIIDNTQ